MQGSIRFFLGLIVTFGAVGTLEADPTASVMIQTAVAALGLALMYSGSRALNLAK